jgi:putative ABC transport system ATP-binding protein
MRLDDITSRPRPPGREEPAAQGCRPGGATSDFAWPVEAKGIGRTGQNGGDWLIRDVSLVVNRGDRLAVLGPTGSGKTVLLRALALLDSLQAGSICWCGRALRPQDVPVYRASVIYLHQRPVLFDGSVEDNLRFPFTLAAHAHKRFECERVLQLLDAAQRPASFLAKLAQELSGGEAQLVALLRAIQLDPANLLLDEPTASLDQASAQAVERVVDGWCEALNDVRAFIWVSHDLDQAHRVSTRRLLMRANRLDPEG